MYLRTPFMEFVFWTFENSRAQQNKHGGFALLKLSVWQVVSPTEIGRTHRKIWLEHTSAKFESR